MFEIGKKRKLAIVFFGGIIDNEKIREALRAE